MFQRLGHDLFLNSRTGYDMTRRIEKTTSRTSGRPVVTGYTPDGRLIFVVYEEIDDVTVYPVTAYDVEE